MKSNDLDFEISFLEGVLKHRPNYIDALAPLAEAYTRRGLFEKGLEIDKRLAFLCQDDPVVHYNLACSYVLSGYTAKALTALKAARARLKPLGFLLARLALVLPRHRGNATRPARISA